MAATQQSSFVLPLGKRDWKWLLAGGGTLGFEPNLSVAVGRAGVLFLKALGRGAKSVHAPDANRGPTRKWRRLIDA